MPFDVHTLEVADLPASATNPPIANGDKIVVGVQAGVANLVGGGAGDAVTTAVSFPSGLPANYVVLVTPGQACFASVDASSKTSTGFNVVLTPTLSSVTLAAGTFDVTVLG